MAYENTVIKERLVQLRKKMAENGIKCIVTHRDIDKEPHRYTKKADED